MGRIPYSAVNGAGVTPASRSVKVLVADLRGDPTGRCLPDWGWRRARATESVQVGHEGVDLPRGQRAPPGRAQG